MYNKMLKKELVQKCQALEAEVALLKSKIESLEKRSEERRVGKEC